MFSEAIKLFLIKREKLEFSFSLVRKRDVIIFPLSTFCNLFCSGNMLREIVKLVKLATQKSQTRATSANVLCVNLNDLGLTKRHWLYFLPRR